MPQSESAKKSLRSAARKRAVNDRWRNKYRAAVKAVKDALSADNKKQAQENYVEATKMIDKAARHGIMHKNKASRIKSRLGKKINA